MAHLSNDLLARFNSEFKRQNLRVVLFIDSYCANNSVDTLKNLSNTKVVFLPPTETSKIQLWDADIISVMKVR